MVCIDQGLVLELLLMMLKREAAIEGSYGQGKILATIADEIDSLVFSQDEKVAQHAEELQEIIAE